MNDHVLERIAERLRRIADALEEGEEASEPTVEDELHRIAASLEKESHVKDDCPYSRGVQDILVALGAIEETSEGFFVERGHVEELPEVCTLAERLHEWRYSLGFITPESAAEMLSDRFDVFPWALDEFENAVESICDDYRNFIGEHDPQTECFTERLIDECLSNGIIKCKLTI